MHIIYKNEASCVFAQFLAELAYLQELFGSKLSEGCCVVSNHLSISSPTVVSKHHWPQYQPLDDLSLTSSSSSSNGMGVSLMGALVSPNPPILSPGIPMQG